MAKAETFRVRLRMPVRERCYGNIMWSGKFPMRGGKFPSGHPCGADPKPTVGAAFTQTKRGADPVHVPGEQPESDTPLGLFRARGYWASCFPEGDGITFDVLNEQDRAQAARDIAECFGWEVVEEVKDGR